jgi:cytochrome c oxidase assembly factor CtaG/cytochrome c2
MQLVIAHGLAASAMAHWDLEPLVVVPLFLTAVLYAAGLIRLWGRAGVGRGVPIWSAVSFAAGWVTLAVALVSPVAWLSGILFSVHMTQHTLLLLVAAPLLTFAQPLLAWLWAFDEPRRERLVAPVRGRRFLRAWHAATAPLSVFLLQAAVLWLWHIPSWYEAALRSDVIHALEHLTLVGAGCLFWWAMVRGRYGRAGYGLAVVYVFLSAVHSGTLGALLTIAPEPWYGTYIVQGGAWGVDPIADQQLAGLLMWIPAGVIFIVLGLALLAAWLGESERRAALAASSAASAARVVGLILLACAAVLSCSGRYDKEAAALTGGSPRRGSAAIGKYGCSACHTIPGIAHAVATVGPPLTQIAVRHYLAGHLVNTPDNMMRWIQHPQQIDPKNAMPDMGVTEQDARDIAAYLYTLR